jgi:hypothetical protein
MKLDVRQLLLGGAIAVVLLGGAHVIRSGKREADDHRTALDELRSKLETVRADRDKFSGGATALELQELPRAPDAVTQRAYLRAAVERLMAAHGLRGAVTVREPEVDASFPSQVHIEVVPMEVGIEDYTAYSQVVDFMTVLTRHPFTVDALCIGCSDIGSVGKVRLSMRYFMPAESHAS